MQISSGYPYPLGATVDDNGVNFSLFSAHATRVVLCLYDASGMQEIARFDLPEKTEDLWHGHVSGLTAGLCYGYRVYGPYQPEAGHRFNHNKLLLDPYARQLRGDFQWHKSHFGYQHNIARDDLSFDDQDNAPWMSKGVIVTRNLCKNVALCSAPHRHRVPWAETILYETHVKGFTFRHPAVPEKERGTFAGLGQTDVIAYLKALGITSVELLPVHAHCDEYFLFDKGLTNYWGYNSLSFFAPHPSYLASDELGEFRQMVERFHEAGLEVILDVVFNHSCEGNHFGPTLSLRGIDNYSYYRLMPGDNRHYINDTGCGNSLNLGHPRVAQLVMDSLRFWVGEMRVDGFRFDLATALGRGEQGFNKRNALLQMMAQDPLLANCKLIAEPWDLGPGGYQLGAFPGGWAEWNDRYRDTARRFWRGDQGMVPELARRLHGSADLFETNGRKPYASVNFITSHDGFTLRDLVSYNRRHNEANLENNNDGHRENLSFNQGEEGETSNLDVLARRIKQQRNFIATLLMSQGVPMLLAGDERGRTQSGNNNAYCQDNEINWIDWSGDDEGQLLQFTRKLIAIRHQTSVLQADRYRHRPQDSDDSYIEWLNGDGKIMREEHWHEINNRLMGYLMVENCEHLPEGKCYLLVVFNGDPESKSFTLPDCGHGGWQLLVNTDPEMEESEGSELRAGGRLDLSACSMQILSSGYDNYEQITS